MTVPTPAPTEIPAPTPAPPATPAQGTNWQAKYEETIAESRKWESQSKANKTAADELTALKAAQMTETEKSAARLAELETENQGYKASAQVATWKADVSKETGVPVAALAGSTLEDIQAHAEVLKTLISNPADGLRGPHIPTEGTGDHKSVSQLTDADLKTMKPEQINQARRDGRLNRMLGIT